MRTTLRVIAKSILPYIFGGVLGFLLMSGFLAIVDERLDNRDEMLCNSAKVSGNEEYTKRCQCFYAGKDIRCIYDAKVLQ